MEAKEIKSILILRGKTQAQIARELDVTRQAISVVLHGRERSQRIENAIARELKLPVQIVFPRGQKK